MNPPQILVSRNQAVEGDDSMEDEGEETQYLDSEVEVSTIDERVV